MSSIPTPKITQITGYPSIFAPIQAVAISPDLRWVACAGGGDRQQSKNRHTWSFHLYDLHTQEFWDCAKLNQQQPHHAGINTLCFNPNGTQITLGSLDGQNDASLSCWAIQQGQPPISYQCSFKLEQGNVRDVVVHPNEKEFFAGNGAGVIRRYSTARADQEPYRWKAHRSNINAQINALCISADGQCLYSAGADQFIRVWEASSGQMLLELPQQNHPVISMALSNDNCTLITGSDQRIKIWDMTTGKVRRSLFGHPAWISGLAITSNNQFFISAGDTKIKIWDLETGKVLSTHTAHDAVIEAIALSSDSSLLVTGDHSGIVKIWQLH